ncbi:hypothetical protein HMPREF9628_00178 [Peptoanaerobacter stomatis]|uniref:HTH cro/C1-type domain-containing protein n=1 Tax=Peptoanaerobacter stomatis TaxID=796937 RepID=G9XBX0_9FIRM|nr:S24 family peptidase [Peptoanaerobacter stomatis]EHL19457.1 hypothetical protein HMPREF9628_00178 [Peptoanaerobacter stomatis]
MSIGDRLKSLRIKNNLTLEELAKKVKTSKPTIQRYESGVISNIPSDKIEKLANVLNTTPAYIMGWEEQADEKPKKKAYKIPVYGEIAAGIPINMIQDIIDYEEVDEHTYNRGELLALKIKGDSMEPRICDGDVVIIRKQPDVDSGEIAAVIIDGDSATLKKVKKDKKGIYLIPFNNNYDTVFYTNKEMKELPVIILGKLIELRGKF